MTLDDDSRADAGSHVHVGEAVEPSAGAELGLRPRRRSHVRVEDRGCDHGESLAHREVLPRDHAVADDGAIQGDDLGNADPDRPYGEPGVRSTRREIFGERNGSVENVLPDASEVGRNRPAFDYDLASGPKRNAGDLRAADVEAEGASPFVHLDRIIDL